MKTRLFIRGLRIAFIALTGIIMMKPLSIQAQGQVIKLDKDLTAVLGGGGNSGILVTDNAVVVIDTKMNKDAEDLYKMAKETAGTKKIIVINTHFHSDHVSGNHFYQGSKIYIGNYDQAFLEKNVKAEDMPTDFVKDSLTLNLGSETLQLVNLGQGHTFDDMVVYLKNHKVLFSGDLVVNWVIPYVIGESGANVDRWIVDLNAILTRWDIKTLVPGHGNVGYKGIAASLRKYFEDMKTAAADPSKQNELIAKYKDWKTSPPMASPEKTIEFIKNNK
jgi:cyclase